MRLPEDKIKHGILHPDRDVRDAAVFYFARSFSQDTSLMPLAIQAIKTYGWSEAFDVYSFLDDLVQTDKTVRWLMDEMTRLGLPMNEPENQHAVFLSSALLHADPTLLQRHQVEVMAMAELNDEAKEAIGERILYQTMEPEQLWNEFETCSQAIDEAENVPSEEIDHGYRIVEALGHHRDSIGEKVLAVLYGDEEESGSGSRWFPVRLAGEMKLAAAIPFVVELLHEDDDWLYEECHRALVKIGTDAVVTELAGEYAEGAWLFRTAVAGILEDIQSDLSVSTCLKLLQREEDQWIKARLLQSILMNFATEGVEPARQFLLQTPLDPDVLELRSALLTACKLMAVDFPEFEAWKTEAKNDDEFRQKWYEDHPIEDDEEFEDEDFEGNLDSEDDDGIEGEDADENEEEPVSPVLPFVREQERVGRNDPCPCGSGKKFKKCCYGRSADAADALAGSEASYRPPQSKPQFPIGTVALYGPDDKKTTKIVAGVIERDGAEPILERWVGSTVKNDPKVQRKIKEFFDGHGVRSVAAMDRNMGCPHEEGEDFPVGEDCPFCPFWKGKQGSNRRE